MYVYSYSPCLQGGTDDLYHVSSIKRCQTMAFAKVCRLKYKNTMTNNVISLTHCHALAVLPIWQKQQNFITTVQGKLFLLSRNITVACLRRDGRVHDICSLIQTTGHCMVLIYYNNAHFWLVGHYLTCWKCLFWFLICVGFFAPTPHLLPTRPLTWFISDRVADWSLEKLSKMAGTMFVIFVSLIEYTVGFM